MKKLAIFMVLICLFLAQPSSAFIFQKKDYKQNFINNAIAAEKKNNHKSAFFMYEKAMYYYGKDSSVVLAYATFCERNKYYDKAEILYGKLYLMTKDKKYLAKKYLSQIKTGDMSFEEFKKISSQETFLGINKVELYRSLINSFAWKNKWKDVKNTCSFLSTSQLDFETVNYCLVAAEKDGNKKNIFKYLKRYSDLNPKDSKAVTKLITMSDEMGEVKLKEIYIKKLITLNPKDKGIKYELAGYYEKNGRWKDAASIYKSLLTSGDKSQHVLSSYDYVLSQINKKPEQKNDFSSNYSLKPLSAFQKNEKLFYDFWKKKDYYSAQTYLSKMLKEQPNNIKLLRHKADISASLNNYNEAIFSMEKIAQIKNLSVEEKEFLSFLYSKNQDYEKALSIIEKMISELGDEKKLLSLAQEYSLATKDWNKSIFYTEKLLIKNPRSEKLLKLAGDLYSAKNDFKTASGYYEILTKYYPKNEYKLNLANLYMADKNFESAENILEPIYEYDKSKDMVEAYLNSLLAQQKTYQAYYIVKENGLLETKEGYVILGDLNLKSEKYSKAANYYYKASLIDENDINIKNNLAFCYRMLGHINPSQELYQDVLTKEPLSKEARLGLGSLEIDKKNFSKARNIFNQILKENPDYEPAKIAVAHSYIANDEKLSALEILDSMPENLDAQLIKGQIFYDLKMNTDAKTVVSPLEGKKAEKLKFEIKKSDAITVVPKYSFLIQQLADEFNLDMFSIGLNVSENINDNAKAFMEYNVHVYYSGNPYFLTNVANEFRCGVTARPSRKFEYRTDIGVKAFQTQGALINTNSWFKYYFNDKFNIKLGFYRDNLIQSYLSAVGEYMNGMFTGRVIDNKLYLEYEAKLPKRFYSFGRGAYGLMTAQNLPTNQYLEGMVGIGRPIYENPRNKWIQRVALDIVTYNSSYQYNLLNLYNSTGQLFGGYFSPGFFTAETGNLKFEGENKKYNLKYGFGCFAGIQNAEHPHQTSFTWGVGPYVSYSVNDHLEINASYNYYNYADVQRHYFLINAIIRGFKRNEKKG